MSRSWNGKALIDEITTRLWDTSAANQSRVREWINDIQNDLVSDLALDLFKFKLKSRFPTEVEQFSINPQKGTAPTAAIAAGGSLTEDSVYKVLTTFIIWDEQQRNYIESEASSVSGTVTATAANKTIDLTAIDTYDGDTTVKPATIWRRVYLQVSTDSGSTFGEPLFIQDIEDNTTTTLSITAESTSVITPPSDSEIDHMASDNPRNISTGRWLQKQSMDHVQRWDPNGSTGTPDSFDHIGPTDIFIYPALESTATDAQRTYVYWVHRRPHEIFYDVDREMDLPISAKKALVEGVIWKGYEFRDRDRTEQKLNNYQIFKKEWQNKMTREKTRPGVVRDINGDTYGYSAD